MGSFSLPQFMHLLPGNIFKLFCIKPEFNINKNELKKKYFELCKINHPDKNTVNSIDLKDLNLAYKILNNDYSRARLLNTKIEEQDPNFLILVLDLEDQIENIKILKEVKEIKNVILKRIEECKKNYKEPKYLSKWVYYERLLKKVDDKEIEIEIREGRG
ncbi:HSB-like chaperone-like protein [Nosema bombycis CQ1]|uniref:HSB-like chaperone-like protein n=1 Tax=Nosema bombycis (strain CQ1 / CVCC 102059) TaxID=578461 RepID=R0KZ99_NOSB1|nr:HSB-like chaperone-like protein [Nosema bombycis CQ1]|eukprot:EOB15532.1 HSB-like chaperone-like protein [Nosema bombycis CQ1]